MQTGSRLSGSILAHEFLPDSRVETIFYRLLKEFPRLPEETSFLTTVQPSQWVEDPATGIQVRQPERLIFWAICPNPQIRWKGKSIKQYATMTMDEWRQAEMEKWRFAASPDPAYLIFRALCPRLIKSYQDWKEMT